MKGALSDPQCHQTSNSTFLPRHSTFYLQKPPFRPFSAYSSFIVIGHLSRLTPSTQRCKIGRTSNDSHPLHNVPTRFHHPSHPRIIHRDSSTGNNLTSSSFWRLARSDFQPTYNGRSPWSSQCRCTNLESASIPSHDKAVLHNAPSGRLESFTMGHGR